MIQPHPPTGDLQTDMSTSYLRLAATPGPHGESP